MKAIELSYEIKAGQLDSEQTLKEIAKFPAEVGSHVLIMHNIKWPNQCPCCLSESVSTTHPVECKVPWKSGGDTGYFFPLEWQVPCCSSCLEHGKLAENLPPILSLAGFLLWALLGYLLFLFGMGDGALGVGLFFLMLAGIGFGAYKLNFAIVKSKMMPVCVHNRYAVTVVGIPPDNRPVVHFKFHNDAYADAFAALNRS